MSVLTPRLRQLLDAQIVGVLLTEPATGRPRQSVVYYVPDGDRLLISSVTHRLKVRDVQRTGWASLCVMGFVRPFPAATFSGSAEILTKDIGPATAALAQRFMGTEEPPEPQTDEALAGVGRVIIAINVEHVGAANYLE